MDKFCDMLCKYAKWPDESMDGSGTCRTFIAVWCDKKKQTVFKNCRCGEKELKK